MAQIQAEKTVSTAKETQYKFDRIPVVALRNIVAFPNAVIHVDIERKLSVNAVKYAFNDGTDILLVAQKDAAAETVERDNLFDTGVLATVNQIVKTGKDVLRVAFDCKERGRLGEELKESGQTMFAERLPIEEKKLDEYESNEAAAILEEIRTVFNRISEEDTDLSPEIELFVGTNTDLGVVADYIAANYPFRASEKQALLDAVDPIKRSEILLECLVRQIDIKNIQSSIMQKVHSRIAKNQADFFLREQLKAIKEELGDTEEYYEDDDDDLYELLDKSKMPDECYNYLIKETKKYYKTPIGSQEAAVIRTYIESCLEIPWGVYSKESADIEKARDVLEKDHYGLEKVKERILETIAVKQRFPNHKGQILCLVGPPGTGKTSIAQSVAKALHRKFVRISLGGINDENEIRGHRRTYVASMPGKIIAGIKEAGTMNPLMLLDEIDKLGSDRRGDPAAALLEVLDPEQNKTFKDHYIDMPVDLSEVFFITTANDASEIPAPLLDRMDVIELTSYTYEEKLQIAKKHLVPKQFAKHGLKASELRIDASALNEIIMFYTREAGVRGLEKQIAALCRKATKKMIEDNCDKVVISKKNIAEYLGPRKVIQDKIPAKDRIGVVTGLAFTSVGGEIMPLEVNVMEGTGKIELTGSLGDVMKESAKAAISYIRSNASSLGISPTFYKDRDIHIHAPEGAVPKDGPSAGCAMATALYSQLSSKPIKNDDAMTGEITIRGDVLAIGGLKEKTMAAYKAGVKTVIVPKDNKPDISEIAQVVRDNVAFVYADSIKDVFAAALR